MIAPDAASFAAAYARGEPQVVWTRVVDDLETPVSAFLKLAQGRPYAFLFESVEGGAFRGRYSFLAMRPDLVWRCRGDRAEIADDASLHAFRSEPGGALDSLRRLVAETRLTLPPELPPMAAGLFGTLGYDMVRLFERLGEANPDPLGLPDAVMIRPSVVAVFDGLKQEIVLVTTVRPDARAAEAAYADAASRLQGAAADLRRPLPPRADPQPRPQAAPTARSSSGPRPTSPRATSSRWCPATGSAPPSACRRLPSTGHSGG